MTIIRSVSAAGHLKCTLTETNTHFCRYLSIIRIYSHISGIDLVQAKDKVWYVLEDNLRVPSGASYPMIARDLCRKSSPSTFQNIKLEGLIWK